MKFEFGECSLLIACVYEKLDEAFKASLSGGTNIASLYSLSTVDLPYSIASPSSEAGGGYHYCYNGQQRVLEELGGYQFYHGALAVRVALVAACLVSLRIVHWNASFTAYHYKLETTFET